MCFLIEIKFSVVIHKVTLLESRSVTFISISFSLSISEILIPDSSLIIVIVFSVLKILIISYLFSSSVHFVYIISDSNL